ncbi:hypothetical protein [Microbulbifer sp. HZ11]|uniref:hypothetical protein n=1 Tax=Microbulbifer sp. HZ11 TaxID=1453501 RepID=UPI0012DE8614|nr:hypothetical protein [Microbulbifer sp. HZ11]
MSNDTEAFNNFTADWKNRIEKLLNVVIVLSGGVMSITIGAYLNGSRPNLPAQGEQLLRASWYLFASSLAASLLLHFLLVISGAVVLKSWEKRFNDNIQGVEVLDSPKWVHCISWLLGGVAVVACLVGLVFVACGAGHALSKP